MYLQFVHKGTSRVAVEIYNNESGLIYQRIVNRYNQKDIQWLAEVSRWDVVEVNQNLMQFCEGDNTETGFEFDLDPKLYALWTTPPVQSTDVQPFTISVRELPQRKQFARQYSSTDVEECLRKAFETLDCTEPLIEWTERDRLCCLDVDYHYTAPPTYDELCRIVSTIRPQPFCWHPSHGGGAKLYYVKQPGFNAIELAAVAGVQWVDQSPTATFDLVKSTRHPLFARTLDEKPAPCSSTEDIHFVYGSGDVSGLKKILASEIDSDSISDFLESRGWHYGQTLPHTDCPISPFPYHKDTVFIGEKGIYCHHCQAKGLGGKTPGFVSYNLLIQGVDNRLRNMVRHFVHLEHARIVLENLYPTIATSILDTIYSVMLKIVHSQDDPRIEMAMSAGRGFVRINGQWVTVDGTTSLTDGLPRYVQSLPTVLVPRPDDGFTVSVPALISLTNAGDTSEYGYYPISYLRGCRIYGQKLPYPHLEVIKNIIRPEFVNCPPTYLTESRRMDIEEAWQLLESEFPGINRTYIKLLICTKGASEGRLAQCPYLMVTGVSSAGKSTSVHIAAGICGDKADEPIFYPDVLRFRASLMDGAKTSGFLCVNEIFKMADRCRMSYVHALDPLLSLTEDSRSHVLYVGSVPFGRLPVFVLTDIECPREILQDYQLARRFTFYNLDSSIDWTNTLVTRNIRPHEFRCISPEHTLAADTILSDIIDEFFSTPTPLHEMARKLKINVFEPTPQPPKSLTESKDISPTIPTHTPFYDELPERSELKETLNKFYNSVIHAPPLKDSHATRYNPECGWKLIDRNVDSDLLNTWNEVADGPQGIEWTRSRVCHAEDWGKLLGLSHPITLEVKPYQGGKRFLYVRFRSTDSARFPEWVNGRKMEWSHKP